MQLFGYPIQVLFSLLVRMGSPYRYKNPLPEAIVTTPVNCQITPRLLPDYSQITARLLLDYCQITHRGNSKFVTGESKSLQQCCIPVNHIGNPYTPCSSLVESLGPPGASRWLKWASNYPAPSRNALYGSSSYASNCL